MDSRIPILTAILTPSGLEATPYAAASLNDAERYEPAGVYTVTRTFHRTGALGLSAHLDRLAESAHLVGIPAIPDHAALRAALRHLLNRAGYPETRFRITIPHAAPACAYFALEPLAPVPESYRTEGVAVQTFPVRRANPVAKSTAWMGQRDDLVAQLRPGVYEGILTAETGDLLEGFGSNFYAILDGTLRTAGTGVLNGISRRIVLEVAPGMLPVVLEPMTLADIGLLQEAFMTSSSRAVIPIVQINDQAVGNGAPGPLTRRIAAAYDRWANEHVEPI
jgi:branched-chain amino acid aminotransferase